MAVMTTELIEFNGWTLRTQSTEAASPKLLVLIHGWTGDENSMWVFTKRFSSQYWIIAPRAPYKADPDGFSWRPPQPELFGRPTLEALKPAAEALIKLIDEYSESVKIEASQFDVIGFSQGGAMVNALGALYPQRVRKMGILAGFVPYQMESIIESKPLIGKNIFVAHGTKDQMVTIERAHKSMELLEQAGATITYCEDEVGHKLSMNCLRALEKYLED
jgi:phospholipase/carboxylesterase